MAVFVVVCSIVVVVVVRTNLAGAMIGGIDIVIGVAVTVTRISDCASFTSFASPLSFLVRQLSFDRRQIYINVDTASNIRIVTQSQPLSGRQKICST